MANTIKLKRGTSTPSTSDIASGEVAIDTSAQKLYINDSGTVKEIGGGGGIDDGDKGDITVSSSGSTWTIDSGATQVANKLPLAGGTITGDLTVETTNSNNFLFDNSDNALLVGDNTSIKFGAGTDFRLSSDGTNDGGALLAAGTFRIASSGSSKAINIMKGTSAYLGRFITDGGVELYHNGTKKAETTAFGFQITGDLLVPDVISHVGDTDTRLRFSGNDQFDIEIGGTQRVRVNSSGATITGTCTATAFSGDGSSLTNISASDSTKLPLAGGTMTGNLLFGDQVQARFGSDSDFSIEHDGGNTFLKESGTGKLIIKSDNFIELVSGSNHSMIEAAVGGAVKLFFDGTKKAESVSGGFTVSGTCTATTFSGSGASLTNVPSLANSGEVDITSSGGAVDINAAHGITLDSGYWTKITPSYYFQVDSAQRIELNAGYGFLATGGASTGYPFKTQFQQYELMHNNGTDFMGYLSYVTDSSVAFGYKALQALSNKNSGNNTAIGFHALLVNTGSNNTAVGYSALDAVTTGNSNVSVGANAGGSVTSGSHNISLGLSAGGSTTDGNWSIFLGGYSGGSATGSGVIGIGNDAGRYSTGDYNTCIGHSAGDVSSFSGSNNIVIGNGADPSASNVSNEITLGNTSITKFRVPGLNFSIKDSTATDNYVLTVDSNGDAGWEAIPSLSDNTKLPLAGGTLTGDLQIPHKLIHAGDTDTCMRFQTNIWSVEVAGNERIETTDSRTKFFHNIETTGTCTATTFSGSGASLTSLPAAQLSGSIANGVTATTQSASDNSTKVATTAYTDTAISNLVDSSPSTLNTLNELAAALGDDANFSTTVTNSIATKLPLAGGTLTGNTKLNDNIQLQFGSDTDYFIKHDGSNCWHKCTTGNLELKTYGTNAGNLNFESAGSSTFKVNENTTALTLASNGNATFGGTCTATTFSGSGASLTSLNASNISSGTIAAARVPTLNQDTSGTAEKATRIIVTTSSDSTSHPLIVQGTTGNLTPHTSSNYTFNATSGVLSCTGFSGSGASLTSLNASNISSGTIAAARVPTLNQNTTGSAATLTTARTIAGVSFDGSANISLNNNAITNGAGYVTSSGNTVIGTDSDIDTSGATIIDNLYMTDGVITSHGTRTLTLGNLGFTGATNANYITNNNQLSNGAGYITSANGGNAATLDSIDSSQFVRSDTADTITATLTARTIVPQSGNSYDLGSSSARWNNLYVNDMNFSNKGSSNSVDGTWGDWTLQEGEEDIFMINNRSGKKYKMALQEVS